MPGGCGVDSTGYWQPVLEFSDQRGHEHADLDGLQSTHSHSKGYISFPCSWRTQTQVTWKVNGSSGIFFFYYKNVLLFNFYLPTVFI